MHLLTRERLEACPNQRLGHVRVGCTHNVRSAVIELTLPYAHPASPSMTIHEQIVGVLQADEIKYNVNQDGQLGFFVRTGNLGAQVRLFPGKKTLKLVMQLHLFALEYRRAAMFETLGRANFGLRRGCFEMDSSDGEVIFRDAIPLIDSIVNEESLRSLIYSSWGTANTYAPALAQVALTDVDPEVAIARVERS